MLWTVRHLWPSEAHFVFNFCCRWSWLVLQKGNGVAIFLHIGECVTQGGTLDMVAYGIGILPLIKTLKVGFSDIPYPWYADNLGALGKFSNVELYFNSLKRFIPGLGYYPKHSKSVLIIHPGNLESGKVLACVSSLECAQARAALAYLSGTMSPNVIF